MFRIKKRKAEKKVRRPVFPRMYYMDAARFPDILPD
jgi:hypothetical protein